MGDFNGDGKQDLAVANRDSNDVSILLGSGGGSFSAAANLGGIFRPYSVAVGDFNGDGKQDLAVTNGSDVSIFVGDGAGSFGAALNFDVIASLVSVVVGDFNGDGKQDLAFARSYHTLGCEVCEHGDVRILLRDCSGTGTTASSVPTSPSLNFGVGANFSIDAWIKTDETARFTLTIVDKRLLSGSNVTGYALYLYNGQVGVQLADGTLLDWLGLSSDLRDGEWHHIAVTVVRNSATGGHAYVDGAPSATFNPTSKSGSLGNNQPLLIGQNAYSAVADYIGEIDEVELFSRAITGADVASIYNAGSTEKCH